MCSVNMLPVTVEESLQNLLEKEGYLSYEIQRQRVSTNGENFLGSLYEVDVKGNTKDGDKETNLFIKILSEDTDDMKWLCLPNVFKVELFAYKELSEVFVELQNDAKVPQEERFQMIKCYEGSNSEVLILDNIVKEGFIMFDRGAVVTLDHAERAIKDIAKFHGLSFALQDKRPDYFNKQIKGIDFPMIFSEDFAQFIQDMINLTMNYVEDDVKSRVEDAYNKLGKRYSTFFEDEASKRCICHGDYKSSNTMIKINNGKITDFLMLDFQFLHYGCPVLDIFYFMYINTDLKFRRAYMSHLKDLYHETLTTFLKHFDIDVDSVYSRETFEQDFKEKIEYGLLVGFALVPLLAMCEGQAPEITAGVSGLRLRVSEAYRERQRGIIEEFMELGYI